MAKNISSKDAAAGFRRLDVDQYDDNSFRDDVSDLTDEGPNESEVNNLLMSGKAAAALKVILSYFFEFYMDLSSKHHKTQCLYIYYTTWFYDNLTRNKQKTKFFV